jgi:hypothetical protein
VIAMATRGRNDVDPVIHAGERHEGTAVSAMAQLTAWLPPTRGATAPFPLTARESVGRWRLRGRSGILLAQGELAFQIRDLSIALRQFLPEPLILSLQSLDFLCRGTIAIGGLLSTRSSGSRRSRPLGTHEPYGTLVMSACTA